MPCHDHNISDPLLYKDVCMYVYLIICVYVGLSLVSSATVVRVNLIIYFLTSFVQSYRCSPVLSKSQTILTLCPILAISNLSLHFMCIMQNMVGM